MKAIQQINKSDGKEEKRQRNQNKQSIKIKQMYQNLPLDIDSFTADYFYMEFYLNNQNDTRYHCEKIGECLDFATWNLYVTLNICIFCHFFVCFVCVYVCVCVCVL